MDDHHLFATVLLIVGSIFFTYKLSRVLGVNSWLSTFILFLHTCTCFFYYYYAETTTADSTFYYDSALIGEYDWTPGTKFVIAFTAVMVNFLNMSKMNVFLVYHLFGVAALLVLANTLFSACSSSSLLLSTSGTATKTWFRYVPYAIVCLPTLHFWSSAIGKDAPAFFAACLFSFSTMRFQQRKSYAFIATIIMFLVRPHVAFCMIIVIIFVFLTSKKVNLLSRALMLSLFLSVLIAIVPFILQYAGFEDSVSVDTTSSYVEGRQGKNLEGSTSVDIASMPLPVQIFTYLFRPLFFDASDVLSLIISAENLFFLVLILIFGFRMLRLVFDRSFPAIPPNVIYCFIVLIMLASTTSNIGIAIRQKTMVLPSIYIWMGFAISKIKPRRNRKIRISKRILVSDSKIPG
jgi:hypothetical protein